MISPDRIQRIQARYQEVTEMLSDPALMSDSSRLAELGREHADLRETVAAIGEIDRLRSELAQARTMISAESDPDMVELAEMELAALGKALPKAEETLRFRLIPRDPTDARNAIIEIRAGTGGDEAALFAGDLYEIYGRYASRHRWTIEPLEITPGAAGGFKEMIFAVKGPNVFGLMKFESGVHRVQRVPATESQGRIHTSAATVAVLPEAQEVDVQINPNDLKIDVYRSSGPGGQSVNTTDSAVRITHIPSGLVVSIQDEKSQLKNKDKALRVLRSRLYQQERDRINSERSAARKEMVGSGDRSAKIRTYNWPQGRVTDHRLEGDDKNHALQNILSGELEPIVDALRLAESAERMLEG